MATVMTSAGKRYDDDVMKMTQQDNVLVITLGPIIEIQAPFKLLQSFCEAS